MIPARVSRARDADGILDWCLRCCLTSEATSLALPLAADWGRAILEAHLSDAKSPSLDVKRLVLLPFIKDYGPKFFSVYIGAVVQFDLHQEPVCYLPTALPLESSLCSRVGFGSSPLSPAIGP